MDNGISLGKIFPTAGDFLRHLTEYGNMTDEEINDRAGSDAAEQLSLRMERDFCKSISQNIVKNLLDSKEDLKKLFDIPTS